MSEMIERVARAIYANLYDGRTECSFDECAERACRLGYINAKAAFEEVFSLARIAVAAMREPTENMMKAAAEQPGMKAVDAIVINATVRAGQTSLLPTCPEGSCVAQAYVAAIDAALNEEPAGS